MLKTVWPKYMMFKKHIEAINIERIEYRYVSDNEEAEFITPPVMLLKDKKYICVNSNKRVSKAKDNDYTHMLCYVVNNEDESKFFNRLNDLTYIKDRNKELITDFEFIFKDEILAPLAYDKCKHLF
jgi:hypothetical protein